jgi:biopolymer transport protein ExbD
MAESGDGPKKARIEIIPLIDVIFFLLATFVLFTLSLNKTSGLPGIHNPKVANYVPRDPSNTVTISIPDGEGVGWNNELLSLGDFVNRLEDYKRQVGSEAARILISGDVNANFNAARYVFEQIKRAGIQKVMIEVNPDADAGPPK